MDPAQSLGAGSAVTDSVDRVMASWAASRPDLDVRSIAILTRLDRVKRAVDEHAVFDRFGLNGADFAVLATLTRVAPSSGLSQRQLMGELDLSSGTISVRVERLVRSGLVTRGTDPLDGRGSIVVLTRRGRDVFEKCAPVHLENSRRLLSGLSDRQHDQLAGLLRQFLQALETPADDQSLVRWGIVWEPAHRTAQRRAELGLPERGGLGVRSVIAESSAAVAGVRVDDLVVGADDLPIRSVIDLYEATHDRDAISLQIVRGHRSRRLTVSISSTVDEQ